MHSAVRDDDAPVPPSECRVLSDGAVIELTDIPIAPLAIAASNKPLRLPQLAALSREQRGTLLALCYDLFIENWHQISFGPYVQGAMFEMHLAAAPATFSYLDGYLTVYCDPSPAHLHLCIGAHRGLRSEVSGEHARLRRCARASFVRTINKTCVPASWSIQLFNGAGEQMITFYLPSPYLDLQAEKRLHEPNWQHLALWNALRARYLGERTSQPVPRYTLD